MAAPILIISATDDAFSYGPVKSELEARGLHVITYNADEVMRGGSQFSARFPKGDVRTLLRLDGRSFYPEKIAAAWYCRPQSGIKLTDKARELRLEEERRACQEILWHVIPERRWLNSPAALREAQRKLPQLALAAESGLTIPPTIVSNSWEEIVHTLPGTKVIFKMASMGGLYSANKEVPVYTHVFDKKKAALPVGHLPVPGIWQTYIPKKKEWRVTIVGSKVFAAAVYTTNKAKDDYRRHGRLDVSFRAEPFPVDVARKCQRLMRKLHLRFGAFDFIETPDGELVFLEVNAGGQHMGIEQATGLPISAAIADVLIRVSNSS